MALLALKRQEIEEATEGEWRQLRQAVMLVGLHSMPEKVAEILEALDGVKREEELGMPEFARPFSDEEMEGYQPFSHEETNEVIDMMRRFGLAVQ